MILFIPIMIIFRNIYSTRLILSVAFISFVLPFGYYITDYWNSVHGFFGILVFILVVGIGVPLYTLLIYLVGKLATIISEKIYSSMMIQFLLIAIGSSLFFFKIRDYT